MRSDLACERLQWRSRPPLAIIIPTSSVPSVCSMRSSLRLHSSNSVLLTSCIRSLIPSTAAVCGLTKTRAFYRQAGTHTTQKNDQEVLDLWKKSYNVHPSRFVPTIQLLIRKMGKKTGVVYHTLWRLARDSEGALSALAVLGDNFRFRCPISSVVHNTVVRKVGLQEALDG